MNDLIMLVAFAPIVTFLVSGASGLEVPFDVLLYSVFVFVVIPLAGGALSRTLLIRRHGKEWGERRFLAFFQPITVLALLATLVLIFAFQAENITSRALHVVLIATPILLQVYFNSSLTYGLMRLLRVPYASPPRERSSAPRTSSSWRSPRRSRSTGRSPEQLSRRSSACWLKCR